MPSRSVFAAFLTLAVAVAPAQFAQAAVERGGAASGHIVSTNGDEQVRFVQEMSWRYAEIEQNLLAGDALRTGPAGALALRFIDQTLIRMQRNSALIVKQMAAAGAAQLELDGGKIWARADKAGNGVDVETPSATVAIRGTDWSLQVEESGRSTLIVIEGKVVMSNAQGSVTVSQGEAAVAEIGRAPSKIILTNPPGREQLLYYASLRDAFGWMPLNDLDGRSERQRFAKLQAIPKAQRTATQWLDLAEHGLRFQGRSAIREAVAAARVKGKLSRGDAARADLMDGMLAASARDWDEASKLFRRAEPHLSGPKKFVALYGRFITNALAGHRQDAEALQPALEAYRGTRGYILGKAWIRANLGEIDGAFKDLVIAQNQHPKDSAIAVLTAQMALLLTHDKQARVYVNKALAIDPDDPDARYTEASILSDYDWKLDAAAETLEQAVKATPNHVEVWNTLGLVRGDLGDNGGSADAFRKAIALDPDDPVPRINYAVLLLDTDQLDAAKEQIDVIRRLDPSFSLVRLAEGRWLIQHGRLTEARDAFLDAVVANPGLSNSYLALAIANYEMGDLKRADQALQNADALDRHDPIVPLVDTVVALDHAEADRAITSAREAYQRYRDRGGIDNPFAPTRDGGSYLNAAFSELSLNDWGRFYGDLTFNPFDAGSQFYQGAAPRTVLTEAGSVSASAEFDMGPILQGLLLDPLSASSRNRYTDLLRRPFVDTTLSSGVAFDRHGEIGWDAGGDVQGYADLGPPVAFSMSVAHTDSDQSRRDDSNDDIFTNAYVGANLSLRDHLLLFGNYSDQKDIVPKDSSFLFGENTLDAKGYAVGAGYSHDFGPRNVLMAAAIASRTKASADIRGLVGPFDYRLGSDQDVEGYFAGIAHSFEKGRFTVRYGVEGQTVDAVTDVNESLAGIATSASHQHGQGLQGQAYGDVTVRLGKRLMAEAGLYYASYDDGIDIDRQRFEPRVGLAWLAGDGQWLRAAYREETQLATASSLAPVTTLGLTSGAVPVAAGGRIKSLELRWDSEWSKRFFTAVELEHQTIDGFAGSLRDTLDPNGALLAEQGRIDRATVSANAWLGYGIGLFGQATLLDSENTANGDVNDGEPLPLIPEWSARFGATWVHPSQLSVTIAENLIGKRAGDNSGHHIDSAETTDIELAWQPFDKRIEISAAALNVFDQDYQMATDIQAPGTTFLLRGELRF